MPVHKGFVDWLGDNLSDEAILKRLGLGDDEAEPDDLFGEVGPEGDTGREPPKNWADHDGGGVTPDGSGDIVLVYAGSPGGHTVKVWAWTNYLRVSIAGRDRFFLMPGVDEVVKAVALIKSRLGALT